MSSNQRLEFKVESQERRIPPIAGQTSGPYCPAMPPPDPISVDGEAGDWNDDAESSVVGDGGTGKMRQYNYAKCATCRERKKKCERRICAILHSKFSDIPALPVRARRSSMARQMLSLHRIRHQLFETPGHPREVINKLQQPRARH
jgi:hypothetical protein